MWSAWVSAHPFGQAVRAQALALLAGLQDPHAELLAMVWGPRFDREHALDLWTRFSHREPLQALFMLPALLSMADRFDGLARPEQHRLRRLITRHRSLHASGV